MKPKYNHIPSIKPPIVPKQVNPPNYHQPPPTPQIQFNQSIPPPIYSSSQPIQQTPPLSNPLIANKEKFKWIREKDYELMELEEDFNEIDQIGKKEFRELIENENFILSYSFSIHKLLDEKISTYKFLIQGLKREIDKIKPKIETLKNQGFNMKEINDILPSNTKKLLQLVSLSQLVIELEEKKKNVNEEQIKKDLIQILNHPKKGLTFLKNHKEIAKALLTKIYAFSQNYKVATSKTFNIILEGVQGLGQTFLAEVISFVLSKSGIFIKDKVKILSQHDVLNTLDYLETVILINNPQNFDLNDIFNWTDCIIITGEEKNIKNQFITLNPSLLRRFSLFFNLKPYEIKDLTDILIQNLLTLIPPDIQINEEADLIYSLLYNKNKQEPIKNQINVALTISCFISEAINGSYFLKWENGNFEQNKNIILFGFHKV